MKEKEEIVLSDLSKRFLEAMETLSITGYRLKQDGIINNEATLTKIKKGIQQPSRKTIELFCERYNINKAWIYTGQGNSIIQYDMNENSETKVMARIIQNLEELPFENRKIYNLVIKQSEGNIKAFSELIGVSQQVLDRIFRIDKRTNKYPSVSYSIKQAIKNKFAVDDTWFVLAEDEDCQQSTPTPKESLQYEAPTFNEMLRVITLLSEQGKENSEANKINAEANKINAEANERNSKNMEKMVNMLERMIGKENTPMEEHKKGRA